MKLLIYGAFKHLRISAVSSVFISLLFYLCPDRLSKFQIPLSLVAFIRAIALARVCLDT